LHPGPPSRERGDNRHEQPADLKDLLHPRGQFLHQPRLSTPSYPVHG
jgi:hypothetical protein